MGGCHGCSLNISGLGGNIHVRDAIDKDEIVVTENIETRGINVSGGCCGIGGGAHAGCHGCGLNICGLGGDIHVRDTVDEHGVPAEEDADVRGVRLGGGCCGVGGGAHLGRHGCSLNICGLGGKVHVRDAIDEDEIVVVKNIEKRGINVGGGCCGVGGGAHAGCHGCGLNICGIGGSVHVRDAIGDDVAA